MNFGSLIIKNNESALHHIMEMFLNIMIITRKENDEFRNIDLKKSINVLNQTLESQSWIVKVFMNKITNLQKSGVASFHNSNQGKKIICIFKNISQKAFLEFIKLPNAEAFMVSDILHSPMESIIQSEFFLLDEKEKSKVFEEFNVNEKTIPKMKRSDIIARFYNANVNDVFKIVRKTPEHGFDIYYRIVTHPTYEDLFS